LQEYENTVRIFEVEKGCHHKNTEAEPKKKKRVLLSVNKSINQITDFTSFARVHLVGKNSRMIIAESVFGELFACTIFIVKGNSCRELLLGAILFLKTR